MARSYGNGVSRTLPIEARQFLNVVFQKGKPPLDAEFNLQDDIAANQLATLIRSSMASGFIQDPTAAKRDFVTNPLWSDYFKLGRAAEGDTAPLLWANVNGWVVPVTGTAVEEGDPSNRVDLWPPPASDNRIDLVFLEVWLAQVAPNSSAVNKPSASTVWKWGNVKYGGTNLTDDIQDPVIGYETTERTQVQYRIRVFGQGSGLGSSVALDDFPDGLDDPNVLGQGTATSPVTGLTFTNMGEALGDAGLWRAGDGDSTNALGTVDGYTYAIPICAIFRRNSDPYVARTTSGNPNQNGSVDRNPTSVAFTDPAEGTRTFVTVTLTNAISESTTGSVQVEDLDGSGLDNPDIDWTSMFLLLDGEIISISGVSTETSPGTITIRATNGRGRWGTMAVPHAAGTPLVIFNHRADGLFADQIADTDILDMRRSVRLGDWDHGRLLLHNLSRLFQGELKTSYKQGGIGDTQGVTVVEVDTLLAAGATAVPNQTEALDGPDGIRTIFSDAATLQPDVTMLLQDPNVLAGGSPGSIAAYDSGVIWQVAADFVPGGFVVGGDGWRNGDIIFSYIGGADGTGGARGTFRDGSERAVRFVGPKEFWKSTADEAETGQQHPVSLRFLTQASTEPAAGSETTGHPGPIYPLKSTNFEKPYIVLGGILNSLSQVTSGVTVVPETGPGNADWEVVLTGLNFDTAGSWYSQTGGEFDNDPAALTNPVLHGTRTLWGMLTDNGRDRTGASSEVYLVIWGDTTAAPLANNGVFRVVGAGTVGYTTKDATAADRLRVEFISQGVTDFVAAGSLNAELRSQYMHASDDSGGSAGGQAAMCIVLTDISGVTGGTSNPWNALITQPVASPAVLHTTLIYHPGRGGTARVPDDMYRFSVVTAGDEYLQQSPTVQDAAFPAAAGVPDDETYFEPNPIQAWNRLSGLGLDAPFAPAYGGEVVAAAEQDREAELFVDSGSKTIQFRPFLSREMTLRRRTVTAGTLIPSTYTLGHSVDGAGIWQLARTQGYPLPVEFMPRFGRWDIPFYVDVAGTGAGTFLQGLNHLFVDTLDATDPQFNIVGGRDAGAGGGVNSILFQTTATGTSGLDYGEYGPIPPGSLGDAYQCRLYSDPNVVSSDLGRGLRGIQLPPFFGIARIYGIFERQDWDAAGGGSMFGSNRITPIGGTAPNLLRKDAKKQTLFIVRGGGEDATGNAEDHTYVIPENLIDVTLSNSYTTGTDFADYEYIVECVVFGFARGFITQNNMVLARRNQGAGGGGTSVTLNGAEMLLPAPAPVNDQGTIEYVRTPYQGDPYMSRAGSARTVSDYEHRYGQIAQADAFELARPIQQFDSAGVTLPQTPNVRGLQVLASVDFWTTLGTGKVGGQLFAGTSLDVGHIRNDAVSAGRVPVTSTDPPFQVDPRAFTEGQKNSPIKASLRLTVVNNASVGAGDGFTITGPAGAVTILAGTDFVVAGTAAGTAANIAAAINASAGLAEVVKAFSTGNTSHITLMAVIGGAAGNDITVGTNDSSAFSVDAFVTEMTIGTTTFSHLQGGVDQPVNSGNGSSSQALTGLIERLPLGILAQDSDFICEDLHRDGTGQLVSYMGGLGISPVSMPLTGGEEYSRLVGGPGAYIGQADGGILQYTPYDSILSPTGTKKFRLFRGGGSAFVLSDPRPGGPVDWTSGSLPDSAHPVLKGGVLVGKALLVRNYPEVAFAGNERTSYGDELQMVILTKAVFGSGDEPEAGLSLTGLISPTGFGEGYAAADRYRLEGYPLVINQGGASPETDVDLAVFPFPDLTSNVG